MNESYLALPCSVFGLEERFGAELGRHAALLLLVLLQSGNERHLKRK